MQSKQTQQQQQQLGERTFSYAQKGASQYKYTDMAGESHHFRVVPLTLDVARLFFTRGPLSEHKIAPLGFRLLAVTRKGGENVKSYHRAFFISWVGDYELYHYDVCVLRLANSRSQLICADPGRQRARPLDECSSEDSSFASPTTTTSSSTSSSSASSHSSISSVSESGSETEDEPPVKRKASQELKRAIPSKKARGEKKTLLANFVPKKH
jgi:hypothetical protein